MADDVPTATDPAGDVLRFYGLTYDFRRRDLRRNGLPVAIGSRGLSLLHCLLERAGEVVDTASLLHAGWGGRHVQASNVLVQISALRRALGGSGANGPIRTVSGVGYVLQAEVTRQTGAGPPATPEMAGEPAPLASFVGRRSELAALREAMGRHRLVTLSGTGGVGKSRLAREAWSALRQSGAAVQKLDLSPALTAAAMLHGIAGGFGNVAPTVEALSTRLAQRPSLLVLDNAEHLATPLAPLLRRLLDDCPGLSILVTSRQTLAIAGEHVVSLLPMPVPAPGQDAAALLRLDSVRLFVERARAVQPDFAVTDTNAEVVGAICRRLDGLALAIELVVPLLRALTPAELAASLDERFRGLPQPQAGAAPAPRHGSLSAMLDWSWETLRPRERDMLLRLSMFRVPVAAAVVRALDPRAATAWEVHEALAGLVGKSLCFAEMEGEVTRYRLLQTTRDYAVARSAAPLLAGMARRHTSLLCDMLELARATWPTTPSPAWLLDYAPLAADLRAALSWSLGPDGESSLAVRLLAASVPLWWELPGPPVAEMGSWADRIASVRAADTPKLQSAWFGIGQSWREAHLGDGENRPAAHRAVAAARLAQDPVTLAASLLRYGTTLMRSPTMAAAQRAFIQAERLLRPHPPGKWLALVLARRADVEVRAGRLAQAMPLYEEAIGLSRALQYRHGEMTSVSNMTELLFVSGRRPEALQRLRRLRAALPYGTRSPAVATLAAHFAMAGCPADALGAIREVVTWTPMTGVAGPLAWVAEVAALLLARAGLLDASLALARHAARTLPPLDNRFGSRRAVSEELQARLQAAGRSPGRPVGKGPSRSETGTAVMTACLHLEEVLGQSRGIAVDRAT